ncbi:hypothetical protein CEXT_96831 [Caerostris extrusa]|uniref:Uncharacterized protein n=1 Tax=Caerostris extrusa TaxID=172846 RepID=A0AAV4NTK8_CAEEX|nr:hypothetical protein CEXT_96831 [Caerostris extrusa]
MMCMLLNVRILDNLHSAQPLEKQTHQRQERDQQREGGGLIYKIFSTIPPFLLQKDLNWLQGGIKIRTSPRDLGGSILLLRRKGVSDGSNWGYADPRKQRDDDE